MVHAKIPLGQTVGVPSLQYLSDPASIDVQGEGRTHQERTCTSNVL
jgi:hypothetical protein